MNTKPGRKSAAELSIVPVKPAPPPRGPASGLPKAPAHLSPAARKWWRSVNTDFDLEPHHLHLLKAACEALDRMEQARQALADHGGLTFTTASGDLRTHPAVAVERDARISLARLVRELDLDAGAPSERSRPPALNSNRR